MLTEVCQYLKNWFNRRPDGTDYPKYSGTFTVASGEIAGVDLANGQYYRIMGSLFNDGVHRYGDGGLTNEVFDGAVWSMSVPPDVLSIVKEIAAWRAKYESIDNPAMAPFSSESFGGYSYTKSSGTTSEDGTSNAPTWKSVFAARLNPWRKL